jgi:protein involved in polysaccharide export with SLBB domain
MRLGVYLAAAAMLLGLAVGACSTSEANLPMLDQSASVGSTGGASGYRLGPGDKLKVTVFGAEDMSGDFIVTDAGYVASPLVGDVKAAGLSPQEFANALQRKLADGYMRDPKVSVQVSTYRPFYIFGEVTKPGEYPYAQGMTVLNAVAMGGGYSYRAQQSYVVVTRNHKDYKAPLTARILPDDVIKVPERLF